jgi:hypothetical protein
MWIPPLDLRRRRRGPTTGMCKNLYDCRYFVLTVLIIVRSSEEKEEEEEEEMR